MCPNIVPFLDENRAYIYCPLCKQNDVKTEMRRDQHVVRCTLGHTFDYAMIQQMTKSGNPPEMIPTVVIENPSPHAVKVGVFMHPTTWETLQQRYRGRLWVTLGTTMDALADGSIVFITGEDAEKLRSMGIKSSKDMVALAEASKSMEAELENQRKLLEKLRPILTAAGVQEIA